MSDEKQSGRLDFLKKFLKTPGRALRAAGEGIGRTLLRWRNWRLRRVHLDYVVVNLSGSFPERAAPPRSFLERRLPLPPPPMSVQDFNAIVRRLIDADNVSGVVFQLQGVSVGLSRLQTLRHGFERLRAAGKRVVVYTQTIGNGHYYLACAADEIIIPRSATWQVFGLFSEVVFLRDALAFAGIEVANIKISPYKSAFNPLSEEDISPEQREQLNWLLDDQYEQLVEGMAAGRGMTPDEMRGWIDRAPLTAEEAQAAGLVDRIGYEDDLPHLLAGTGKQGGGEKEGETAKGQPAPASLHPWPKGGRRLRAVYRRPVREKKIAVISLEGVIIRGESQRPPVDLPLPFIGGQMAGDQTLRQLMRQVEQDDEVGALVFHVDSRGGDALASDIIGREVARLAQKLPVVVYMGDVAASGGYYVSAPAREIICQPGTITGSIGVVMARPNTDRLYENLRLKRVALQRGARADLYTDYGELTEAQRETLEQGIQHAYRQFKEVVADGREIPYETLDPICEGRVWTGRQAADRGLIDRHGGFLEALAAARRLAGLPATDDVRIQVENIYPERDGWLLPLPFDRPPAGLDLLPLLLSRLRHLSGVLYLWPVDLRLFPPE